MEKKTCQQLSPNRDLFAFNQAAPCALLRALGIYAETRRCLEIFGHRKYVDLHATIRICKLTL